MDSQKCVAILRSKEFLKIQFNVLLDLCFVDTKAFFFLIHWRAMPIRTPGRVSVARKEIEIRFFGYPNPENYWFPIYRPV